MNTFRVTAIGAAFGLAMCPAALAGHGKVGTWEVTTQMKTGGMPAMPNMANLPPEIQARMKSHGVQMNAGGGMTSRFCMTADQVNGDKPPMTHRGNCQAQNMKMSGSTFSADVVCTGHMNAKGHIELTFDKPEHYSGHQTMTMTMEGGQPMTNDMTMDARWVAPDCTAPTEGKGKPTP
jgi:hypothetical protein